MPNILVVDDDADILQSLRGILEVSIPSAHVATANSGQEALHILKRGPQDALVTDYRMPNMDGIQLVKAIPRQAHLAIVMITAFNHDDLEDEAAAAGICAVIPKPIEVEPFITAVETCMAAAKA